MNVYDNAIIEMLTQHILSKDQAIEKLCAIIKELVEETRGLYIQLQTKEVVESIDPPKKKGPPVKSVIRWEPKFEWGGELSYDERNRAVGIVYEDGFFEFARYIDGVKVTRTQYRSVDEWMASLPEGDNYTYTRYR